jgi:hypothetical protein
VGDDGAGPSRARINMSPLGLVGRKSTDSSAPAKMIRAGRAPVSDSAGIAASRRSATCRRRAECPSPVDRPGSEEESNVWTSILVMAVCVALLGALAMRGTESYKRPVTAVLMYLILPVLASAGFVTLSSLSG